MLLDVSVEINGSLENVGKIITKRAVGGVFQYSRQWIESHPDMPLSISLPVSSIEFKVCAVESEVAEKIKRDSFERLAQLGSAHKVCLV